MQCSLSKHVLCKIDHPVEIREERLASSCRASQLACARCVQWPHAGGGRRSPSAHALDPNEEHSSTSEWAASQQIHDLLVYGAACCAASHQGYMVKTIIQVAQKKSRRRADLPNSRNMLVLEASQHTEVAKKKKRKINKCTWTWVPFFNCWRR